MGMIKWLIFFFPSKAFKGLAFLLFCQPPGDMADLPLPFQMMVEMFPWKWQLRRMKELRLDHHDYKMSVGK